MSPYQVIDTGPLLRFLTVDAERELFIGAGGPVHVCEAVEREVQHTPLRRRQFLHATDVFRRLAPELVPQLSDAATPELEAECRRVFGTRLAELQSRSRDQGESMALLHALVLVATGANVRLLCDDGPARVIIRRQINLLVARKMQGRAPGAGSLALAGSVDILRRAVEMGAFPGRDDLRRIYGRMAALDEALDRDILTTGLLDDALWKACRRPGGTTDA